MSNIDERLHVACASPFARTLVQAALHAGASVQTCDSKGRTPLHVLARNDQLPLATTAELIDRLLHEGASLNAVDTGGVSPILMAAQARLWEVVHHLRSRAAEVNVTSATVSLLGLAVRQNRLDQVKTLLEAGVMVNVEDRLGRTPLHEAVSVFTPGQTTSPITDLLLKHGANAAQFTQHQPSPLANAIKRGAQPLVVRMLKAGAARGLSDTPLCRLIKTTLDHSPSMIPLLIQHGALDGVTAHRWDTVAKKMRSKGSSAMLSLMEQEVLLSAFSSAPRPRPPVNPRPRL